MDEYIGLGRRDLNAERHWQEIEQPGAFNNHRRKILVLCGDGTETAEEANGMCKAVAQVFAGWSEPPEFYGIYYKNSSPCAAHRLHQKAACNQLDDRLYPLGRKPAPYLDSFYQQHILPLVSAKEGKQRLTTEEAAQNLRSLAIVTHCHGSTVLLEIEKKLKQSMSELGYNNQERSHILRQLFSLNVASTMPLEQTETTALHVISQADGKSVKGWRFAGLNHTIQTHRLKTNPTAFLELSDKEQVMLLKSVYKPEIDEIDGASPDEHLGSLYFDFSIYPEARTETSHTALNIIHQTLKNAVTAQVPLLSLAQLQDSHAEYSEFIKNCRREGKAYLAKEQKLSAQINEAEAKLWTILQSGQKYDFSDLPPAELLVRRNAGGQTPFDFVMSRGNMEEIKNMQASIADYRHRHKADLLPARLLSGALEKAAAAKRFDIVDCFIEKGVRNVPAILTADKLEADDIPAVLPILQKVTANSQSIYSLLPLYLKSSLISNPLSRRNCKRQLEKMLFAKELSLQGSINLYHYCQPYDEIDRNPLQKGYLGLISDKIKSAKDFSDIRDLEISRQSTGREHALYENLAPAAKLKIEQICHKEMKRHLSEYVKAAVLRGSRSDYCTMDTLFCRSMTEEQRLAFQTKMNQANQTYMADNKTKNNLIADLTAYLKQANRKVFSPEQKTTVAKPVREH